jgi:hypothetical protein
VRRGFFLLDELSSRDCATASIQVDGDRVYFSSVYLDIHLTIEEPSWLLTLQKSTRSRSHMLAGIDSNSHSDVWGSPSSNRSGSLMESLLFKYELCVLNEGNSPTFQTRQAATCIDITVATPALASLVTKWTVQNEMHKSDHHLITMELLLRPDKMPLRKGRKLKKADWDEFRNLIDISLAESRPNPLVNRYGRPDDSNTTLCHRLCTRCSRSNYSLPPKESYVFMVECRPSDT